jgi:CBS domain containing-hemolysin-like protein
VTPLELLVCLGLVLVSAFFAASEIALFSLSRFQLRALKERMRSVHRRTRRLLSDPGGLLITILVVNEVVNISLSAIVTAAVAKTHAASPVDSSSTFPPWARDTLLGLAITAPIVLFACEITPKVVAARANELIATLTVRPLSVVYDLFKPVRWALRRVVALVARLSGGKPDAGGSKEAILKESEFLLMVEEGHREGAIHSSELELIKNVFELDDTAASEVLTPLHLVQTLTVNTTMRSALTSTRGSRYSRVPVLSANRKQVLGIVHTKDLLKAKLQPELMSEPVTVVMRKPLVVSPTIRLNALFRKFKQQRTHMAVVQAQDGEPRGVVTMSDVIEALFEDILEEAD